MDKKWIIAAFIAIFALSSCLEKEVYQGPEEDEKEFNDFDFSTVQSATSLEVSYANSGVKANVYFEVYDEIPVEQNIHIPKRQMSPRSLQHILPITAFIKVLSTCRPICKKYISILRHSLRKPLLKQM